MLLLVKKRLLQGGESNAEVATDAEPRTEEGAEASLDE